MPQLSPDALAGLDGILTSACDTTGVPGAQAALVRRGELLWAGAAGLADTEARLPVTDTTVFCLASLGKTLVAALALRQSELGRLDLDRPVGNLVPEVPGASVVTPRMLLAHTAGYPEIYATPELAPLFPMEEGESEAAGSAYDPDRAFTWEMLLPGFREPVDPGERWAYSNGGYILLTELLVRLLGGPGGLERAWDDLARRATGHDPDHDALTPDRDRVRPGRLAHGYDEQEDGTIVDAYAAHPPTGVPTDLFGPPFGDGLFAGTASGVAAFLDGLFVRGTVLAPATLRMMTTTTPQASVAVEEVPDPPLTTYGLGTFRMAGGGGTWQGHRGLYGGFTVLGMSERDRGLTLAVLTNVAGRQPHAVTIWQRLAEESIRATGAAG